VYLRTPVHNFSLAQKRVGVTSKRRQFTCRTCQTVYSGATAPSSNPGSRSLCRNVASRCRGKPPRTRRPNFEVRRASASCNLTVGSWKCRQAATRADLTITRSHRHWIPLAPHGDCGRQNILSTATAKDKAGLSSWLAGQRGGGSSAFERLLGEPTTTTVLVYNRFTEGFETTDLKLACALLLDLR
jgi:hypothetical protein